VSADVTPPRTAAAVPARDLSLSGHRVRRARRRALREADPLVEPDPVRAARIADVAARFVAADTAVRVHQGGWVLGQPMLTQVAWDRAEGVLLRDRQGTLDELRRSCEP
jgi:hypothetical protein